MIMNQPYELNGGEILVILSSPLQEDLIQEFRTEIIQFLRQRLKNNTIQLTTKVVKPESKKMVYTPQEKFNYLAEKHPVLLKLRERLGLDPDF